MEHLCRLVDYAVAMRHRLEDVNVHSFNNFDLRVGISCGPLVGGVIGARKPVYDIWGNTVNEASRMDSTGVMGKIQVPYDIARVSIMKKYTKRIEFRESLLAGRSYFSMISANHILIDRTKESQLKNLVLIRLLHFSIKKNKIEEINDFDIVE